MSHHGSMNRPLPTWHAGGMTEPAESQKFYYAVAHWARGDSHRVFDHIIAFEALDNLYVLWSVDGRLICLPHVNYSSLEIVPEPDDA